MLRNSPPKGSISFGYKLKEKEIVFHVADTGSGISDDKIDKIFDRFIMANNQVQGTGLGLSISKIIVEKLGGKIAVQSKMGTGTTFTFTLPYISANGDMKWEEKLIREWILQRGIRHLWKVLQIKVLPGREVFQQ